jgi:hypothetical protein
VGYCESEKRGTILRITRSASDAHTCLQRSKNGEHQLDGPVPEDSASSSQLAVPVREDGSTDNQLAGPAQVRRSTLGQLVATVPTWYPPFRPARSPKKPSVEGLKRLLTEAVHKSTRIVYESVL